MGGERPDFNRFRRRVDAPGIFALRPEGKEKKGAGLILMYAGHGSQQAELGKKYYENDKYPFVKTLFDEAHEALVPFGYDLKRYLLEGSEEDLNRTEHAQPCIVAYNIAMEMIARHEHPDLFKEEPYAVGGQSLGYLNALHRAGVFGEYGSSDALSKVMRVAYFRGQVNQMLADFMDHEGRGTGLVWRGIKGKATHEKIEQFRRDNEILKHYFDLEPAIISSDVEVTFGGPRKNMSDGLLYVKSKDTVSMPLASSSSAFHTDAVEPVDKPMREALGSMHFKDPQIRVISNTRSPAQFLTRGEDVKQELFELGPKIVRMDEIYRLLREQGFDDKTFHLGEKGITPKAMLRDPKARRGLVLMGLAATAAGVAIGYILRDGDSEGT